MIDLKEVAKRLQRVRDGETLDDVYGTTPTIIDGPANSWYAKPAEEALRRHAEDQRAAEDAFLKLVNHKSPRREAALLIDRARDVLSNTREGLSGTLDGIFRSLYYQISLDYPGK